MVKRYFLLLSRDDSEEPAQMCRLCRVFPAHIQKVLESDDGCNQTLWEMGGIFLCDKHRVLYLAGYMVLI